jgi:hypothetical protein
MAKQKKLIEDDKDDIEEVLEESKGADEAEIYEADPGQDFRSLQTVISYEGEEYHHMVKLNNRIDEIFESSRWTIISPSKKIPKDLIPLIFQDILKELENSEFSMVEKFVAICDYTAINYVKAYESIHMKYKEIIVQEMDKKYNILGKKGIKKIF